MGKVNWVVQSTGVDVCALVVRVEAGSLGFGGGKRHQSCGPGCWFLPLLIGFVKSPVGMMVTEALR